MTNIFVMRSGREVTLTINSRSRSFMCDTVEAARELYKEFVLTREHAKKGSSIALDDLMAKLDKSYRLKTVAGLEKDDRGLYYLGGYNEPLPSGLVEKIMEYVEDGLDTTPLLNFWKLLLLNPNKEVRNSLFNFAQHFRFPITDKGYFVAYKSVAWKGKKNENLGLLVAQKYVYAKAAGKSGHDTYVYKVNGQYVTVDRPVGKTGEQVYSEYVDSLEPATYHYIDPRELSEPHMKHQIPNLVYLDLDASADTTPGYRFPGYYQKETPEVEVVGTLNELFFKLDSLFAFDDDEFTDWHTKTMSIKLGKPVMMPRGDCDENAHNTCSRGLHAGTPQYVQGFGDSDKHILAVLINPANVTAVPVDYQGQKLRCCEYLPYAVCELNEDGTLRELDTMYFEDDYADYEVEELEKQLEIMKTSEEVSSIVADNTKSLEERKQLIRDRLTTIKA